MDVDLIIEKLSDLSLVRPNKIIGDWYSVYCPFHSNGNERRASCGVSRVTQYKNGQTYPEGMWHCFTCGAAYDMVTAVSKILESRSISKSGQDWLIENIPGYEPDLEVDKLIPQNIVDQVNNKFALDYITRHTDKEIKYVDESELASYRYTVQYMYDRRLTDEIISKYDVGVDVNWIPPGRKNPVPCITFPVRDKYGRTLFICRRSIVGKLFNYPTGVTKPLYGVDNIAPGTKSVIICESCFNTLTAAVYGYQAVGLLGTGNSYQISQLKELGVSEYVICMDGDEAGRRAAKKLKRELSSSGIVWTINMPDGKDINDCDKDTFDELYASRE